MTEKSKTQFRIKSSVELAQQRAKSEWIEVDAKAMHGTYKNHPTRAELPADLDENKVVELYSK